MPDNDDFILQSHENRIEGVEDDVKTLTSAVLPALARLTEAVEGTGAQIQSLDRKLDEKVVSVTRRVQDLEAKDLRLEELAGSVAVLHADYRARRKRRAGFKKWVMGSIGTLVLAALTAFLGLK